MVYLMECHWLKVQLSLVKEPTSGFVTQICTDHKRLSWC